LQQAVGLARIRHTEAVRAEETAHDFWLDAQVEKAR
jgi:hypothetical protein